MDAISGDNTLVIDNNSQIGDECKRCVFLGENANELISWCKKNSKEFLVIPDVYGSETEIKVKIDYLLSIKKRLLAYLSNILNEYHNLSYSVEQWNVMLSQWLSVMIDSYYDRFLRVEKAFGLCKKYNVSLTKRGGEFTFIDYLDYLDFTRSELGFAISTSETIEYFYKEKCSFFKPSIVEKWETKFRPKTFGWYKIWAYRFFSRFVGFFFRRNKEVMLYETYLPFGECVKMMLKAPKHISNYLVDYERFERKSLGKRVDIDWRNGKDYVDTTDRFEKFLYTIIKSNLPTSYLEDFGVLKDQANRLFRYSKNPQTAVCVCKGTCIDEVFKRYLMDIKCDNFKLRGMQHGGLYGTNLTFLQLNEYEMVDLMYTWGWSKFEGYDDSKFIPMPMCKQIPAKKKAEEYILYVSYSFPKSPTDYYDSFYPDIRKMELGFLRGLSSDIKKQLKVRLMDTDYGWGVRDEIEKSVSGLRYDDNPNYYDSMSSAKLVISLRSSTTNLESLAAGIPTIFLLNRGDIIQEYAREDLSELKRVNVVYDDVTQLNYDIKNIAMDVNEWWKNPDRKAVIDKFVSKYCYNPSDNMEIWVKEIRQLAET